MEGEISPTKLKMLIFALALVVISGAKSCREVRFMMGAQKTMAGIEGIAEIRTRRGKLTGYKIHYVFTVDDEKHGGSQDVSPKEREWYQVRQDIEIEYLDNKDKTSRLPGHQEYLWVGLFVFFVMAGAALTTVFVVNARKEFKGTSKKA